MGGLGQQMAAAVETEPTFRVTGRMALFQRGGRYQVNPAEHRADVAADGRFLMVALALPRESGGEPLVLVQNWLTEVRERLGLR